MVRWFRSLRQLCCTALPCPALHCMYHIVSISDSPLNAAPGQAKMASKNPIHQPIPVLEQSFVLHFTSKAHMSKAGCPRP
mmetsp:Transcript_16631/g.27506  ORF Transcript_16631/g.27506 Transcript_16631/m.27506 type:complete len:80 (-) Transcript_16631:921-1160(-)